MIKFNCQHCDQQLKALEEFAGSAIICPDCEHSNEVPKAEESSTEVFKFHCPLCEQRLSSTVDLIASEIACPACTQMIFIPDPFNLAKANQSEPVDVLEERIPPEIKKKISTKNKAKKRLHTQRGVNPQQTARRSKARQRAVKKSKTPLILILCFILVGGLVASYYLIPKKPSEVNTEFAQELEGKINTELTQEHELDGVVNNTLLVNFSKEETQASENMIKELKPFMEKYCLDCHNEQKQKGDIRLDGLNFYVNNHESVYEWQDILDVLNAGEMPPKKETQPKGAEIGDAIAQITERLNLAKRRLASTGGQIKMRHLNKREYYASIKDLFDYDLPNDFLYDDAAPGFDTNGADQFFTSASLDNYLEVGEIIAKLNLQGYTKALKKPRSTKFDPEINKTKFMKKQLAANLKLKAKVDSGATYKDFGFKDEGRLILEKRRIPDRIAEAKEYLAKPEHKYGSTGSPIFITHVEAGMHYKFIITAGSLEKRKQPIQIMFNAQSTDYGKVTLIPTSDKSQRIELPFRAGINDSKLRLKSALLNPEGTYIDAVEIKGPYPSDPSFSELIFKPLLSKKNTRGEDFSKAITKFSHRAFRHQAGNDEFIAAITERFKKDLSKTKDPISALSKSISLILASPSFLYIAEKNNGSRQEMSQKEFAIRLAFFLWESPPDATLYKLAESRQLYKETVLKQEFERMLKSDKAGKFLTSFVNQWADIKRFDQIDLPKELQGGFSKAARAELSEFFKVLVHENLAADKLISSDFVVINQALATHYGMTKEASSLGQKFTKVKLASSNPRGGLLGQAAFLIMGTSGERTSPTIRGTLVRTILLNDPPPEPPANVPEIEETKDGVVSVKELVEHHKSLPQCSSCHNKIDPVGLGLENFDRFGAWRDKESLRVGPKKKRNMRYKHYPLDTNGYLSENERFSDFNGLQKALLKNKRKLAESLYASLLSYGLGRNIEFIDQEDIQENLDSLKRSNYPLKDMIFALVNSKTFRTK
ncbi:DUF1592 domain-containing protein [Lentisphaera profundi]|uniref:DUF1592 domain-containing protein n=1 Tax=Lentisphaera profundi TaxID=1658616 RepID=A0ABY7W2V3_9BACT|nr:DUF1588 domain-containing protein [Lentisphaera profundi]WDE99447.1 DUF1592 domain-containing protein [Lentisphaera profundi]